MKITSVYIQNFLTIGRASLELADRGLHLIQGQNDDDSSTDSNGAGKSSVVDAICWCLYGVTARGVGNDSVVNDKAKKDCYVAVKIQNGAATYKVQRFRKDKLRKNALEVIALSDPPVDLSKGTNAETQRVVEQILGCSLEVFLAAVYSGQELMPDLPKKTDKELKTLIEEAAGLQRIERAYEEACDRRNNAKRDLGTYEAKLAASEASMARIEKGLEEERTAREVWEAQRATRVAENDAAVTSAKVSFLSAAAVLQKAKPAYEAAQVEIASIDKALTEHSKLEDVWRKAQAVVAEAQREADKAKMVASNAQAVMRSHKKALDDAPAAMALPCVECGKPHTPEELEEFTAHTLKRYEAATEAVNQAADVWRAKLDAVEIARAAADKARALIPDVTEATKRRRELQDSAQRYTRGLDALKVLKSTHEAATAALEARKTEPNPHVAVVARLEKQLAEETSVLADLKTTRDAQRQKLEIAESVVKVFGAAGVRAQILDTVTPYLNARTADYLSVLSDGNITAVWTTLTKSASGDLKEKFSISVANSKGADSFLGLSGGEKRKVRLATALALQDLVASRATQPIDLWIGDEIDDALDRAGLERLMTILERKARERGTVLVISHNSLTDWIDEVTVVRKRGGVSQVEGSLCS